MNAISGEVDMTQCLYQGREDWLKEVTKKNGGDFAVACASIVPIEVETMDQLEKRTGKSLEQVFVEARAAFSP